MDQQLLEVVVCPVTRSKLRVEGEFLISEVGGIKYPIKDGIPVLIAEQAVLPEGITSLEEAKKKFQR
jgi:uncharacterized protein YbaR (Trm112 family)